MVTLSLAASDAEGTDKYVYEGDVVLDGEFENARIECHGDVLIPEDSTLTLVCSELVFLNDSRSFFWMEMSRRASLVLLDGDGDPSTLGDGSIIRSAGRSWLFRSYEGLRFQVTRSEIRNLGLNPHEGHPYYVAATVYVDTIELEHAVFYNCYGDFDIESDSPAGICLESVQISGMGWLKVECDSFALANSSIHGFKISLIADARVEGCSFYNSEYAIRCHGRMELTNSTLERIEFTGLYLENGQVLVANCTFVDCAGLGIDKDPRGQLVCRDTLFKLCGEGLKVEGTDTSLRNLTFILVDVCICILDVGRTTVEDCHFREVDRVFNLSTKWEMTTIANCSFTNVSGTFYETDLLVASSFSGPTIENCTFDRVHDMFQFRDETEAQKEGFLNNLWFLNNTISNWTFGIQSWFEELTFEGNTISGPRSHVSLYFLDLQQLRGGHRYVYNVSSSRFIDCLNTINLNAPTLPFASALNISGCVFEGCDVAINVNNSRHVSVLGSTFRDCAVATSFLRTSHITVQDVSCSDCDEGLRFDTCEDVLIENVRMSRMRAITVNNTVRARWVQTVDFRYERCVFSFAGEIDIGSSGQFVDSELLLGGLRPGSSTVRALGGVRVSFEGSSLSGTELSPFQMIVGRGSTLFLNGTSVSRCGHSSLGGTGHGILVQGGTLEMRDSAVEGGYSCILLFGALASIVDSQLSSTGYSLVVHDGQLRLEGSEVTSELMGACYVTGSKVTILSSSLEGPVRALEAVYSELFVSGTLIQGPERGIMCTGSNVSAVDLDLGSTSNPLWCMGSQVRIQGMEHAKADPECFDQDSIVRLCDVNATTDWRVEGALGCVERLWSHSLVVLFNWSMEPVPDARIRTQTNLSMKSGPDLRTDANGSTGDFWVLHTRQLGDMMLAYGPYRFSLEAPGLAGCVSSPADGPWSGVLPVDDIQTPLVEFKHPADASMQNTSGVDFEAFVWERGSGLDHVFYTFDGEEWHPLEVEAGNASFHLDMEDGGWVVTVRAADRAGRVGTATISLLVDTEPPEVWFRTPKRDATLPEGVVRAQGSVDLDAGSQIVKLLVNDVPVRWDVHGRFEHVVDDLVEGANSITATAEDAAGNERSVSVRVVVDSTPPELELGQLPARTNDPTLLLVGAVHDLTGTQLLVNGVPHGLDGLGGFSLELDLEEGRNHICVHAEDAVGNMAQEFFEVLLDTSVSHQVLSPSPGELIQGSVVTLDLVTDPLGHVRVVGHADWVGADANGSVTVYLEIPHGTFSNLTVEFRDDLGNLESVEVELSWMPVEAPTGGGSDSSAVLLLWAGTLALVGAMLGAAMLTRRRPAP